MTGVDGIAAEEGVIGGGAIDVHAHLLMPTLHAEVERRAPGVVAEAAALDLRRNSAASQAVSGPMVGARIPKLNRRARAARRYGRSGR